MHRLFVALRPPAPIREQLLDTMQGIPEARWQDDEQLHVTMRYIGEVDRRRAEAIAESLQHISAPPVTGRIEGVGSFDTRGRINAIWARVGPREPLAALFRKVDRAVVLAGQPPEGRAYLPHITLARFPARGAPPEATETWLALHAGLASPDITFDHLILYESHLGQGGARYEIVARWPFAG